jgi:hypothetical protein
MRKRIAAVTEGVKQGTVFAFRDGPKLFMSVLSIGTLWVFFQILAAIKRVGYPNRGDRDA